MIARTYGNGLGNATTTLHSYVTNTGIELKETYLDPKLMPEQFCNLKLLREYSARNAKEGNAGITLHREYLGIQQHQDHNRIVPFEPLPKKFEGGLIGICENDKLHPQMNMYFADKTAYEATLKAIQHDLRGHWKIIGEHENTIIKGPRTYEELIEHPEYIQLLQSENGKQENWEQKQPDFWELFAELIVECGQCRPGTYEEHYCGGCDEGFILHNEAEWKELRKPKTPNVRYYDPTQKEIQEYLKKNNVQLTMPKMPLEDAYVYMAIEK